MDTPATSRKRPASSPLNVEAFQPTCSVRSIFPPRAWPSSPPTMRSCFIGTGGGGGVIAREIVASRVQIPLRFVLRLRLQKGGGGGGGGGTYLQDTTVFRMIYFRRLMRLQKFFNENFPFYGKSHRDSSRHGKVSMIDTFLEAKVSYRYFPSSCIQLLCN